MAAILVPWYRKCARVNVVGDLSTAFRLLSHKDVVKGNSHTLYPEIDAKNTTTSYFFYTNNMEHKESAWQPISLLLLIGKTWEK